VKQLLREVRGDDLEPAVVLGLLAGLRAGEVCGIRWGDVNLAAAELTVRRSYWGETKSGEPRNITLTKTSVARLREHKRHQAERLLAVGVRQDDATPVVADGVGEVLPPWRLHRQFADLATALDLEGYTFHSLRHSHAVALLTAGVDVRTVAERLGHSPAVLLRTYAHFVKPADQAAAERLEHFLG
jgi:integrase